MKRLSVRISDDALSDIAGVYHFVYERSRSAVTAERFAGRIYDACERIGDAPFGGRNREDLAPGLRTVPFERRAVIVYRVESDAVEIVNVFYGGRDYEAMLAEPAEPTD